MSPTNTREGYLKEEERSQKGEEEKRRKTKCTPVHPKEGGGDSQEREDDVEREEVVFNAAGALQLNVVVDGDGDANDKRLPSLHSIDPGENINRIGAKDGQHPHVEIVQDPEIQGLTEHDMKRLRDHDLGPVKGNQVNHEKGNRGESRQPDLVSPAKVQHIIRKSQQNHAANRQQCRQELGELEYIE